MARVGALAVTLATALSFQATGNASDPWAKLHRPLHLPVLAAGARCPVSALSRLNFAKYGVGDGIGPGPAYPVGFGQPGSVLHFV